MTEDEMRALLTEAAAALRAVGKAALVVSVELSRKLA